MKRIYLFLPLLLSLFVQTAYSQSISPVLFGHNIWLDKLNVNGSYVTVGAMDNLWDDLDAGGTQLVRAGGIAYDVDIPPNSIYLEWVNKIQAIGAEPMLQISRKSTPQQAKDLVTYINVTMNKKVKYWIIGNEPDWHWNMSTPSSDPYYVVNAGTVRDYIKSISSAIKTVDPTIQVVGPEVAWMNTDYLIPLLGGWADITGKDANGNYYVDVITYHQYNDPTGDAVEAKINTFLGLLNQANVNRPATNKLKWAITEFNITTDNTKETNPNYQVWSFYAGQYFAEAFGLGMKYGALTICPWSVQESNGARTAYDLGMFDTAPALQPRSNYHHYSLLANNFGGTYAAGTSTVANVKTFGSVKNNEIAAIILNETGSSYTYSLGLSTQVPVGTAAAKLTINAGVRTAYTDQIAANETHLLVFDLNGNIKKKCIYNLNYCNSKQFPTCQTFTVGQNTFNGIHYIPGTIEAEDYDYGGNQLSFNDATSGNQGGAYRTDDVDIETCSLGGYDVGWIDAGDWMEYTTIVNATGYYDFKIDVATTTPGSNFRIEFDGVNVTGQLTAPNTGGWQTFQSVIKNSVYLTTGTKVMRVYFETGGMNLNKIIVTPSTSLPVTLVNFSVESSSNAAIINWSTSQEINNSHFEIQHSNDGEHFDVIGNVKGVGNSQTLQNYHFIHSHPDNGTNYYRLVQYDFDGKFEISEVKILEFGDGKIIISPMPFHHETCLSFDKKTSAQISVIDIAGKIITETNVIDVDKILIGGELPSGIYILQIMTESSSPKFFRIIKE